MKSKHLLSGQMPQLLYDCGYKLTGLKGDTHILNVWIVFYTHYDLWWKTTDGSDILMD